MRTGNAAAWAGGVLALGAVAFAAVQLLRSPPPVAPPPPPSATAAVPSPRPADAVAAPAPTSPSVPATEAVSGRVLVGKEGEEPAAGALVEVFASEGGPVPFLAPLAKGECGADGRFRVAGLEKGTEVRVRASRSGLESACKDAAAAGDPIEIRLGPGSVVAGVVKDAGSKEPLAGAKVSVHETVGALTGSDGAFRLEGVEKRSLSVEVTAPGYADAKEFVREGDKKREKLVILLQPASSVAGVVLGPAGEPVGDAKVTVSAKSEGGRFSFSSSFSTHVQSGQDGKFRVDQVRCGTALEVAATTKDSIALPVEAGPLSKGVPQEGIVLRLVPAGALVVTVVDGEGRPVEKASVGVAPIPEGKSEEEADDDEKPLPMSLRRHGSGPGNGKTDAEGRVRLGPLATGRMRVTVVKEDFRPARATADSVAGAETAVAVKLDPGVAITGTVVDEAGKAVAGAQVNLHRMGKGRYDYERRESGPDGAFRVGGLEGKGFDVSAEKTGFVDASQADVDPAAGPITLTLHRGGSIAGTVVDEEGKPVPSFRVSTLSDADRDSNAMAAMFGMDEGTPKQFEDPAGKFRVDGLDAGTFKVTVRAADLAPGRIAGVKVETGATAEVKVVLPRGLEVRGVVVRKGEGTPVAGASVSIRPPGPFGEMDFEMGSQSEEEGDPRDALLGQFGIGPSLRTDAEGRFVLKGLEEGKKVNVSAKAKGFAPAVRRGIAVPATEELRLELAPGAVLEGTVRDARGEPKAGANVMLQKLPATMRNAETDAGGRYRIEGLAPGSYLFYVMDGAAGMMVRGKMNLRSEPVTLEEGKTLVKDYRFGEGTKVTGRVTRAGKPVEGVMVAFLPGAGRKDLASAMMGGGGFAMATTNEDGVYEIAGIAPGVYTAMVQSGGGGGPAPGDAVEVRAGATEVRRDIALSVSTIRGVVVDADGAAVSGAGVQAVATGRSTTRAADLGEAMSGLGGEATSGGDGKFAIEDVNPGSYTLRVVAAGKGVAVIEGVTPSEQGTEVRVVLDRGVKVTVRVVDAEGKPVPGAGIYASNAGGHDLLGEEMFEARRTGDDGRLEVEVPAGSVQFEAVVAGHAPGTATATAAAGVEVVVTLPRGATLDVLVTGSGGSPESGAGIKLLDATGNPYAPRLTMEGLAELMGAPSTGADGRYSRADLPAGRYTVRAIAGERTADASVTLVAGEKTTVTVRLP